MSGASGRRLLLPQALLAITLVAYLPALRAGFIWDDEQYVTQNLAVRAPDGIARIWLDPWAVPQYYPVTLTSFWLEHRLWGDYAPLHHAVNVLLHAASAILVFGLLRRLRVPGAFVAAAVFAVHPVHVESVAWVTERKNVLSALFFLLSIRSYLRFAPPESAERGGAGAYASALALFVFALLSKTVAGSLPAVVLLLFWWKRGRIVLRDVVPLVPFFALALVGGGTTAWLERHRVGAWGPDWDLSLAERVLVAGRALWFYAGKLVWPTDLTFVYPRWRVAVSDPAAWLYPVSAVASVAALWAARERIGRGPLVAVLYFAGVLFPALSFADVFPMLYSYVADHFQYTASLGLIVLVVALAARALRYVPGGRILAPATSAAILAALTTLTWSQAKVYQDIETLWRDTLAKNPDAWMAHANLASYLHVAADEAEPEERNRRIEEAEREYLESLRLRPGNLPARINLAHLYEQRGDLERALEQLRAAADVELREPPGSRGYLQHADAWYHLGRFLAARGRGAEAEQALGRAVAIRPELDLAHAELGRLLFRRGDLAAAEARLREAVRLRADSASALSDLGGVLAAMGDPDAARDLWERALRADPDLAEAHNNMGVLLLREGRVEDALVHLRRAVELNPSFDLAQRNLAEALTAVRDPEKLK